MNKKALTLSIVIPAYNEEHHLKRCLDAIAKQTVKPDEVIVVNNNSADGTAKIAKGYPFVKVIDEKRQGVVFARDIGFDTASSDIIGRIDADTILPPDWVSYVKRFYGNERRQDSAWTSGCYYYNVRLPRFFGWVQSLIVFRMNQMLLGHHILWGSNMALTREQWQAVRGMVCHRTDIHEDIDLAIHLHRLGHGIVYEPRHRVGAKLRRVRSHRNDLWENLQWWPRSLRVHHIKGWVISWAVGVGLVYLCSPIPIMFDRLARFFGRRTLPE